MKTLNTILLIITFLIMSVSCVKPPMPECYSNSIKDLKIRWGTLYLQTQTKTGYQINSDASLWKVSMLPRTENLEETKINYVDANRYCRIMRMLRDTILQIQILNEPGDSLRFIEYENEETNTMMRAMWNPTFKTPGSNGFRGIYDSLQSFVPFDK